MLINFKHTSKLLAAVMLFLLGASFGAAQTFDYGNAWYDHTTTYVKFRVSKPGIYRVTKAQLDSAAFSPAGKNIDNFQLVYRGKEKPLHIEKDGSGNFLYLEFYGMHNDGFLDSLQYRNPVNGGIHDPNVQTHRRLSLYTDTAAYFLLEGSVPGARYTTVNNNNYSVAPVPDFRFEYYSGPEVNVNAGAYNRPSRGGGGSSNFFHLLNSDYVPGEGYSHANFTVNAITENLLTAFYSSISGNPTRISTRVFGASDNKHHLELTVNNAPVPHVTFDTNGIYIRSFKIDYTGPLVNPTNLSFSNGGVTSTEGNILIWVSAEYDRQFTLDNSDHIAMKWNDPNNAYFRFVDADINTSGVVYDPINQRRYLGIADLDTFKVIVTGHPSKRELYLATDNGILSPVVVPNHSLVNLSNINGGAEYVILSNKFLKTSVQAFANYRDTCTVNPFASVKIVYVDEIYDEFGYGSKTPWAIKRFCKYAIDNWAVKPKFFVIWGKGKFERLAPFEDLVPTYGYPATDFEYVSNYNIYGNDFRPQVPIGRVSIDSDYQGLNYLEKVDVYEHSPWDFYMKKGLYLGGGNAISEQKGIELFLNESRETLTNPPIGGVEHLFQKKSGTIETNSDVTIGDHINAGLGLIHYFGHSSQNILDIDIELPIGYTNYNKFPLMVAFGCHGGDFAERGRANTFGERWIHEKGRGAIGYLAMSSAGLRDNLGNYGFYFFHNLYDSLLGQSIGVVIQETINDYLDHYSGRLAWNHVRDLNYQGDPAVVIHTPEKPDLQIEASGIFFDPEQVSASMDSFKLNIIAQNFGLASLDSVNLNVRQLAPNNNWVSSIDKKLGPIRFIDTLQVIVPNNIGPVMAGLNHFDIFIDSEEQFDEYDENNNRIFYPKQIPGNVPAILYPYEFAVIDSDTAKLSASFAILENRPVVEYIYQIDTAPEFNSNVLRTSNVISGTAFYSEWDVPFQLKPDRVYFWRVKLASSTDNEWATSSFKYVPNKRGWAQGRPFQFIKNQSKGVHLSKLRREWEFDSFFSKLHVWMSPNAKKPFYDLGDGKYRSSILVETAHPSVAGVMFMIIDQHTLEPKLAKSQTNGSFGHWDFINTQANVQQIEAVIKNLKHGDYFLLTTMQTAKLHSWPASVFASLSLIGCSQNLQNLDDDAGFILFGRKGYANSGIEILGPNIRDPIANLFITDLNLNLKATGDIGTISSPLIGPTTAWHSLDWKWSTMDLIKNEIAEVKVYAVNENGTHDSLIHNNISEGFYSLASLDATKFPFLRLEARVSDTITYTAPQLADWTVFFDPVPDAVIDPITNFQFLNDTVEEGEDITLNLHILNLKDMDFQDSMLVKFTLERSDRTELDLGKHKYPLLKALDGYDINFSFNTLNQNLDGRTKLRIELNPGNVQPELYHFNNIYVYPFNVVVDRINPILDVLVDGRHLMNGDIVAPDPEIQILLNDENRFLAVHDTAVEIYFGKGTHIFDTERIFVNGNPLVEVIPAEVPGDNKARLTFMPGKLEDGTYFLSVQGFDHKGNLAGETSYDIQFEVINESAISNVLNYPNPFSTKTHFVYTLTGTEIPEEFYIRIYTITGRLIKTIDILAEDSPHIGYNISKYSWDGRDDYGDYLANGVYIYRVTAKLHNRKINTRDEGIGNFFNNGYGKLYIMR